jgi:hypothetical protein
MPERIQRKRTAGWKMPPNTVYVGRPTDYGNRYVIGREIEHIDCKIVAPSDAKIATMLYREWIEWQFSHFPSWRGIIRRDLGGKNLACWCAPGQPCHADVLLELANEPHNSRPQEEK